MVRELVGFLQVLRGEEHGGAVGDQVADERPRVEAGPGVQSGGRFVEDEDLWAADKAGAQVEAASHASRVGLDWPVGRLEQAEPVERFLGSRLGHLSAQSVEPADHHQVLSSGEGFVDRGVLAGQADEASNSVRVVLDIDPADPCMSGVGGEESGQDPHQGGLPGPVGSQQALHAPRRDAQVDADKGFGLAKCLADALHVDHGSAAVGDGRSGHIDPFRERGLCVAADLSAFGGWGRGSEWRR